MKMMTAMPKGAKIVQLRTTKNEYASCLNPIVFLEDHCYCCVLGDDFRYAIKGFGHTPEEALEDWEMSLKKRIRQPFVHDELTAFVVHRLAGVASAS